MASTAPNTASSSDACPPPEPSSSTSRPICDEQGAPPSTNGDLAILPRPNDTNLNANSHSNSSESLERVSAHTMIQLPNEIWSKVIKRLAPKDLKNARRVNRAWKDFSTPLLFRTAVFSPEPANIKSLRLLAKHDHLAKHVERLYLDCTSNFTGTTALTFAEIAASYFATVMALGPQTSRSPLCEKNLLQVLLTDSSKPLGHKYLTGRPRGHFIAAYTLYSARMSYAMDIFQKDQVYGILELVTRQFKNLKHMGTLSHWSTTESPYQEDFQKYLVSNLPRKSLELISGINIPSITYGGRMKECTSVFDAPGVSARDLHVMMPGPCYSGCHGNIHWHEIINPALRALRKNKIKLESLSLPGEDYLGYHGDPDRRSGMVPLPSLLEGATEPLASKTTTVLLPLFRHLKVLELSIDFTHPGNKLRRLRDGLQSDRLRKALQQMKEIESLSLGAVDYLLDDPRAWDLSRLLLFKEEDYVADAQNNDDLDHGPLATAQDMLNMLFGTAMEAVLASGIDSQPHSSGTTQSTVAPANTATATTSADSSAASSQTGASNTTGSHTIPGCFTTSTDENGNVVIMPIVPPMTVDFGTEMQSICQVQPAPPNTPLFPNPWPKLKHLSLFNLPGSPNEITRLAKTVQNSLRTLKLRNIHFADHYAPRQHLDAPELRTDVHVDRENLDSDADADADTDAEEAKDDPTSDEDLPSLIDIQGSFQPATSSDTAKVAASATNHNVDEVHGDPYAHTSTTAVAATSTSLPGSCSLTNVSSSLRDPETQGSDQSQTRSDNNPGEANEETVGDEWLSTIELLADELRLNRCQISLHEKEEAKLRAKLSRNVSALWMILNLNAEISRYLLEGSGMGFTLHLSNTVGELTRAARKLADDEDDFESLDSDEREKGEWKDDVGSEDESSEDCLEASIVKKPRRNVHVCSVWQPCP